MGKRIFDVCVAVCLLAMFLVPMILIGLLVRFTSSGPVIFRQERVGLNGKLFTMYKFRTMHVGCDQRYVACPNDDRITAVGRFLRPRHLDELPQLWNVLVGDMSLVGPRPETSDRADGFIQNVTEYGNRLQVRPGITGTLQLLGRDWLMRNSPENAIEMELRYIHSRNFWTDFVILLKTIPVLWTKPGM